MINHQFWGLHDQLGLFENIGYLQFQWLITIFRQTDVASDKTLWICQPGSMTPEGNHHGFS